MALNLGIGFPIPLWIRLTKDAIAKEIESGFEMEAIPLVKEFQKTKLKIKTEAEASVLKKLNDMYEDPQFGPVFFVDITKCLRSNLLKYRMSRDNPDDYGHFFHCYKVSPGIIVHFNSVTRKNQILFLLTEEDKTRRKRVKLSIGTILRWHRNRKAKALKAQLEEMRVVQELRIAAREALLDYMQAHTQARLFQTKFITFLGTLNEELSRSRIETRRIAAKKLVYRKALEGFKLYCEKMVSANTEHENNFGSLDSGMFEEKDYLRMQIDHFKNWAQSHFSEQAKIEGFLAADWKTAENNV